MSSQGAIAVISHLNELHECVHECIVSRAGPAAFDKAGETLKELTAQMLRTQDPAAVSRWSDFVWESLEDPKHCTLLFRDAKLLLVLLRAAAATAHVEGVNETQAKRGGLLAAALAGMLVSKDSDLGEAVMLDVCFLGVDALDLALAQVAESVDAADLFPIRLGSFEALTAALSPPGSPAGMTQLAYYDGTAVCRTCVCVAACVASIPAHCLWRLPAEALSDVVSALASLLMADAGTESLHSGTWASLLESFSSLVLGSPSLSAELDVPARLRTLSRGPWTARADELAATLAASARDHVELSVGCPSSPLLHGRAPPAMARTTAKSLALGLLSCCAAPQAPQCRAEAEQLLPCIMQHFPGLVGGLAQAACDLLVDEACAGVVCAVFSAALRAAPAAFAAGAAAAVVAQAADAPCQPHVPATDSGVALAVAYLCSAALSWSGALPMEGSSALAGVWDAAEQGEAWRAMLGEGPAGEPWSWLREALSGATAQSMQAFRKRSPPEAAGLTACCVVAALLKEAVPAGTATALEAFMQMFCVRAAGMARDLLHSFCSAGLPVSEVFSSSQAVTAKCVLCALELSQLLFDTFPSHKLRRLVNGCVAVAILLLGGSCRASAEGSPGLSCEAWRPRLPHPGEHAPHQQRPAAQCSSIQLGALNCMSPPECGARLALEVLSRHLPSILTDTVKVHAHGLTFLRMGLIDAARAVGSPGDSLAGVPQSLDPAALPPFRDMLSMILVYAAHGIASHEGASTPWRVGTLHEALGRLCGRLFEGLLDVYLVEDGPKSLEATMLSLLSSKEEALVDLAGRIAELCEAGGCILNGMPTGGEHVEGIKRAAAAEVFSWRTEVVHGHIRSCTGILKDSVSQFLSAHAGFVGSLCLACPHLLQGDGVASLSQAAAELGAALRDSALQYLHLSSLNAQRSVLVASPVSAHRAVCASRASAPPAISKPSRKRGRSSASSLSQQEIRRGADAHELFGVACAPFIGCLESCKWRSSDARQQPLEQLLRGAAALQKELQKACFRSPLHSTGEHRLTDAASAASVVREAPALHAPWQPKPPLQCAEWEGLPRHPLSPMQVNFQRKEAARLFPEAGASDHDRSAEPHPLVKEPIACTLARCAADIRAAVVAASHTLQSGDVVERLPSPKDLAAHVKTLECCASSALCEGVSRRLLESDPEHSLATPWIADNTLEQAGLAALTVLSCITTAGVAPSVAAYASQEGMQAIHNAAVAFAWVNTWRHSHHLQALLDRRHECHSSNWTALCFMQDGEGAEDSAEGASASPKRQRASAAGKAPAKRPASCQPRFSWLLQVCEASILAYPVLRSWTFCKQLAAVGLESLPDDISAVFSTLSAMLGGLLRERTRKQQLGSILHHHAPLRAPAAFASLSSSVLAAMCSCARMAAPIRTEEGARSWETWRAQQVPSAGDKYKAVQRLSEALEQQASGGSPRTATLLSHAVAAVSLRLQPCDVDSLASFSVAQDTSRSGSQATVSGVACAVEQLTRCLRNFRLDAALRVRPHLARMLTHARAEALPDFLHRHAESLGGLFTSTLCCNEFACLVLLDVAGGGLRAAAAVDRRAPACQGAPCPMPAIVSPAELFATASFKWLPCIFTMPSVSAARACLRVFSTLITPVLLSVGVSTDHCLPNECQRYVQASSNDAVLRTRHRILSMRQGIQACHAMARILATRTGRPEEQASMLLLGQAMSKGARDDVGPDTARQALLSVFAEHFPQLLELLVWQLGEGKGSQLWQALQALCIAGFQVMSTERLRDAFPSYLDVEAITGAFMGAQESQGSSRSTGSRKRPRGRPAAIPGTHDLSTVMGAFSRSPDSESVGGTAARSSKVQCTSLRRQASAMSVAEVREASAGASLFLKLMPLLYLADVRFMSILTRAWVQVLTSRDSLLRSKRRVLRSMQRLVTWMPPGIADQQMNALLSVLKISYKQPALRALTCHVWLSVVQQLSAAALRRYAVPLVVAMQDAALSSPDEAWDVPIHLIPFRDMPGFLADCTPQGAAARRVVRLRQAMQSIIPASSQLPEEAPGPPEVIESPFIAWVMSLPRPPASPLGVPAHPFRILDHPLFLRRIAAACEQGGPPTAPVRSGAGGLDAHFSQSQSTALAAHAGLDEHAGGLTEDSLLNHLAVVHLEAPAPHAATAVLMYILACRSGDIKPIIPSLPSLHGAPASMGSTVQRLKLDLDGTISDSSCSALGLPSEQLVSSSKRGRVMMFSVRLQVVLKQAASENGEVALAALSELHQLFHRKDVQWRQLVLGDSASSELQDLSSSVSQLVQMSRTVVDDRVRAAIGLRLGQLGAIDPSRLDVALHAATPTELSEGDLASHVIRQYLCPGIYSATDTRQLNGYSFSMQELLRFLAALCGVLESRLPSARTEGQGMSGAASVVTARSMTTQRQALSARGELPDTLQSELQDTATVSAVNAYWTSSFTRNAKHEQATALLHGLQEGGAVAYVPKFETSAKGTAFDSWSSAWCSWCMDAVIALACHLHPHKLQISKGHIERDFLASQSSAPSRTGDEVTVDTAGTVPTLSPETPRVVVRAAMWKAVQVAAGHDQRLRLFLLPYVVRDVLTFGAEHFKAAIVAEVLAVLEATAEATVPTALHHKATQTVFNLLDTLSAWSNDVMADSHFLGGFRIRSDNVTRVRLRSLTRAVRRGQEWVRFFVPTLGPNPTHKNRTSYERSDVPEHVMSRLHEMVLQEMQAEHAAAEWITDPAQLPVAVITQACLQVGAHARAVRYWEQFLRTAAGTPFQSAVQLTGAGKENPVGGVMHGTLPYTRPQLALLQKIYSNLEDPDGLAGVSSLRSHLLRSISDAQEDSTLPMQSRTALLDVSVAHTGQAGAAAGDQGVSQEEAPEGPGAAVQQSSLSLAPTLLQLQENIIDFESAFRWDDALMAYDQALAILPIREGILHTSSSTKSSHSVGVLSLTRASCHVGALHCLIQLGQEHTAFLRAQAVLRQSPSLKAEVFPVAVELAWRLQRWPDLQRLLDSSSAPSGREPYRVAMARAMLGVWRLQQLSMQHDSSALKASSAPFSFVQDTSWLGDWSALPGQGVEAHPSSAAVMRPGELLQAQARSSLVVPFRPQSRAEVLEGIHKSVNNAVLDVMASLSAAAAESHTRAYPHLARLHCLWELLQATMIGREVSAETFPSTVLWPQRLRCTLPLLSSREPIHTLRRVIFSMHGLTNAVGDSLIQLAADARAAGGHTTATAALLRASHIPSCKTAAQVEMAKLLYSEGQHDRALAILEPAEIDLEALSSRAEACEDDSERERLLTPMLLATQWLAKGHRTDEHIYARYQTATQAVRTWEEAWYVMGRFQEDRLVLLNTQLHDLLQTAAASSDRSRELRVQEEKLSKQRDEAIVKAVKFYAKCLFQAKQRHTHESLPKVLTMYFDYGAALARAEEGASTTSVVGVTATGSDKIKRPSSSTFSTLHLMMNKLRSQMGGFLWMLVVPQLASRICHRNRDCATFLVDTLKSLTNSYWRRMVWTIVGLASSKKVRLRKERATQVIKQLASEDKVGSALKVGKALASALIAAAELKPADGVSRVELSICNKRMLASVDIALPTQDNLMLPLSVDPGGSLMVAESAVLSTTSNIVTIQHFESAGQVMSSKEKPKRITCVGSDGKRYYFLCKQERRGDLRKDARMMEYCVTSNRLWRASPDCQRRGVSMSTYAVTCLNEVCGIMEWLGNTSGFRGELTSIYRSLGEPDPVLTTRNVRRQYEALQSSSASMDEKVTKYRSRILPRFTPVFHKWFLRKFSDPSAWFEARLQFSRSAAAWSMAGHIIGLGDRHGENLLLNTRTGACCHVDFDCIFDKGLTLSIPEIVPFRASPNMLDGMGITGYEGVFRRASEACMHTLRESQGILLAQLESFIHDPLVEWSRADGSHSARAAAGAASDAIPLSLVGGERVNFNGVRMVARIEQRLQGHYNIGAGFSEGARPRPSQRSRPGSARASASDLSRALAPDGTPLNVAGQVDRLLKEATSDQNLLSMYIGWMPFL